MIETKTISCFEALVRWEHPTRGLLSPGVFIPLAEETGIIVPLGRWVLEHACRQTVEWQEKFSSEPPLTVSVNVSPKEISQPDFVDNVLETLKTVGLRPDSLKLEVTEGVLMESAETNVAVLRRLGMQEYECSLTTSAPGIPHSVIFIALASTHSRSTGPSSMH